MNYHIMATFPTNRDNKGTLKAYNASGALIFGPVSALGRGSNHTANGYDHTNWRLKNADVPTGVYNTVVHSAGATASFGPHQRVWFNSAVSGNALIAQNNGRDEIMVHGGNPETNISATWYPLRPTYGCIRLTDNDQESLMIALNGAGGGVGKITIS